VRIVGAQPPEGSRIPGIRKWPEAYLPKIYDPAAVDELVLVSQADAEDMARRLAREEGLFCGISAAGACWVALQMAQVENATIVFIVCDRGDRYLSTGVFPACSAHVTASARLCHAAGAHRAAEDGGRQGAPALPGLRLDALEQPHAGAGGGDRVPTGRALLLARNAAWPGRMFALITGFMEAGETPEDGIRREVAEETALRGAVATLIGVYDFQRMNQVIIAYHVRGARRDPAVARAGRVQALRARDVRCWRAGTGLALADWLRGRGHEPQLHRAAAARLESIPRCTPWTSKETRHPRPELPAAHPEGQEGAGGDAAAARC
jgi:ADP-ribose pyrophosphatase YjhB (NUDIX family)